MSLKILFFTFSFLGCFAPLGATNQQQTSPINEINDKQLQLETNGLENRNNQGSKVVFVQSPPNGFRKHLPKILIILGGGLLLSAIVVDGRRKRN